MERLTSVRVNGIKSGYWSTAKKDELIQRLGAYEDTGLEPEEVRELARASKFPVMPGRVVWFLCEDFPRFFPETNGWYISSDTVTAACVSHFSVSAILAGDCELDMIPYTEIGKTVFLSEAEAQAELDKHRTGGDA